MEQTQTGNIRVIKPADNFEKIHSSLIEENDCLTIGVYCKVIRLGETWNLNIRGLATKLDISPKRLRKIIVELESKGFVRRVPVKQENGRFSGWDYEFYAEPAEDRTRAGRADLADNGLDGEPTSPKTDKSEIGLGRKRVSDYIQTASNIQTACNNRLQGEGGIAHTREGAAGSTSPATEKEGQNEATLFGAERQASVGDGAPQSHGKKNGQKSRAAPFVPPTLAEVREYIEKVRRSPIDPVAFFAHYENNDWRLSSGRRMKDWRLAVVTWERRERNGWGR